MLLISDEVYEHMVFDGARHQSAARFPGLAARAFIVSSFGKTYHVTGWKVGYVAAPASLTAEFRKVHQFNVFTVNTPMQHGLASYMADPAPYLELPAFYQRKRDLFRDGPGEARASSCCPAKAATSSASTSRDGERPGAKPSSANGSPREIGVAAIPLSAFYGDGFDQRVVRFCFAKKDETLQTARSSGWPGSDSMRRSALTRQGRGFRSNSFRPPWRPSTASKHVNRKEKPMSLSLILLVVLILLLIGALPTWGHSRSWGYGPSGGLGLVVIVIIVLLVMGRI